MKYFTPQNSFVGMLIIVCIIQFTALYHSLLPPEVFYYSGGFSISLVLSIFSHAYLGHFITNIMVLIFAFIYFSDYFTESHKEFWSFVIVCGSIANITVYMYYTIIVGDFTSIIGVSSVVLGLFGLYTVRMVADKELQSFSDVLNLSTSEVFQLYLIGVIFIFIMYSIYLKIQNPVQMGGESYLGHTVGYFVGVLYELLKKKKY